MHAIQGAMAIRRERQKREQRRMSQIKKRSGQGSQLEVNNVGADSSNSQDPTAPVKTESSLTAFHLGVVFILLGFLMVFSSMISGSRTMEWSNLLGVGATFIMVGLVMVMVNRIITEREDEQLAKYVHHRLGRTRSGYAMARDVESYGDLSRKPSASNSRRPSFRQNQQQSKPAGSSLKQHHHQRRLSSRKRSSANGGDADAEAEAIAAQMVQNGKIPLVTVTSEDDGAVAVALNSPDEALVAPLATSDSKEDVKRPRKGSSKKRKGSTASQKSPTET